MKHALAMQQEDAEDRGQGRTRALVRARLRGAGLERDATILDLSSEGLLLTAPMPPRPTQVVTVLANGYAMTGEVMWVDERRFGVSLVSPILVDDVIEAAALKQASKPESPPLPDNFGVRPPPRLADKEVLRLFESMWFRAGLAVIAALVGMAYFGVFSAERPLADSPVAAIEAQGAPVTGQ